MFIYTTRQISVTEMSDIKCDICGNSPKNGNQYEYATLTATWLDGSSLNKQMCKSCINTKIAILFKT